jgi:pseudaminic acid biosynthesis-associated methylase
MKDTDQMEFWKGNFGDEYTARHTDDFDAIYKEYYGVTRTALNKEFLAEIPKEAQILEVGCNRAMQLRLLERIGFSNLWGIEINRNALAGAREKTSFNVVYGSALDIPFKDTFFDLVYTSGVLIHIAPQDVPKAIDEIYRVSRKYIWGLEYYAPKCEEIDYRGHKNRLWKNDFLRLYLDQHPDLQVVRKKVIKSIIRDATDMMFLLEKK